MITQKIVSERTGRVYRIEILSVKCGDIEPICLWSRNELVFTGIFNNKEETFEKARDRTIEQYEDRYEKELQDLLKEDK